MNNKNIQYFLTVANEHSISTAAQKLYITQPSLSQAIKRIEDYVGVPLFKRTTNGLQLTNTGEQFYSTAMQTEKIWQNFSLNLSAPDTLKEGTLSFGITMQLGLKVLPDILIRFHQKFPKVNCNVHDAAHTQLEKEMMDGSLDLAITHIQHHQEHPTLSYDTFFRDPFVIISSPERDFSDIPGIITTGPHGPEIDIRGLKGEKFIYTKRNNQTRRIIDATLARGSILKPEEYLVNNQFQTIQALVSANLGIGIIPRSYLVPSIQVNIYNIPEEYEAYWDSCIITRKNYTLNSLERSFVQISKDICIAKCT
ncbi:MAG: LysR family transcriptional regulator [Lachnospiraceae bacterium]|nr:LysR family transcriptional regulator [Lachnospiraceae bacterium]